MGGTLVSVQSEVISDIDDDTRCQVAEWRLHHFPRHPYILNNDIASVCLRVYFSTKHRHCQHLPIQKASIQKCLIINDHYICDSKILYYF